jgi:hypothetical protein
LFERYTEKARRVVFFARYEASQFGGAYIENEHLLLGILREDAALMKSLYLAPGAPDGIRKRIEASKTPMESVSTSVDMPLSHAAKIVLARAAEEAKQLNHLQIAPVHLLLGLLRDEESLAAEILKSHGIEVPQVRELLARQSGHEALAAPNPPDPAPGPPPEAAMMQMVMGFWVSRAIYTAAKLGLSDLVNDGPKSVDDLAKSTRSHPQSLYRLMRALASVGVFEEIEPRRFATTPLGQTLITDRPGTLRYFAIAELGQEHYSAWEEFPYSIRTGHLAFLEKFKEPVWQYYATHSDEADVFNRSMSTLTEWVTDAILKVYDFSGFDKIVDVGGGLGTFLTALLAAAPTAHGVVFDAPQVIAEAAGVVERIERVAGNFFESVPAGGDLYTLKMILHDWTDTECITILSNIRKAIAPGGKLLIVETVLAPGPDAPFKNFLDLNMMVMTGGCERTGDDFRMLLEKSGFVLSRVIPSESPMSIVEAIAQ